MAPFIRPFETRDREDTVHICRATLPPTLAASPAAVTMCAYVWTHQFTFLSPETCLVLDDGAGRAVGYVIGCPDVFAFAAAYPRYVDEVLRGWGAADVPPPRQLDFREPWLVVDGEGDGKEDTEGGGGGGPKKVVNGEAMSQLAYSSDWLLSLREKPELVGTWRAMMHIDILPPYQGKGWGKKMIETLVESIKRACEGAGEGGKTRPDRGKGLHLGVDGQNTKVVAFYERCGFRVYEVSPSGSVTMVKDF